MIPTGVFIFGMLFLFFVCVSCFVLGAYVMYCKDKGANPLKDSGFYIPKIFNDPPERQMRPEEVKGFYE